MICIQLEWIISLFLLVTLLIAKSDEASRQRMHHKMFISRGTFALLYFVVVLAMQAESQCSEAHRETCSWQLLQLQSISNSVSLPQRYVPDYNDTTLRQVCRVYRDYVNCSLPFLSSCVNDVILDLQILDGTFGLICGILFKGYLKHRTCFQRMEKPYDRCQQKEELELRGVDKLSPGYKTLACRSSKDYVLCVYTATALGCSMQAADVYFKLLNRSISNLFRNANYLCALRHPMDVISIYTTTPPIIHHGSMQTSSQNPHGGTTSNLYTSGSFRLYISYKFKYVLSLKVMLVLEFIHWRIT